MVQPGHATMATKRATPPLEPKRTTGTNNSGEGDGDNDDTMDVGDSEVANNLAENGGEYLYSRLWCHKKSLCVTSVSFLFGPREEIPKPLDTILHRIGASPM